MKTKTKLNVSGIVQRVIETAVVWKTKNIDKCVIREDKRDGKTVRILQTQKINVEVCFKPSTHQFPVTSQTLRSL
jgi:hypothetical protein